MPLKFIRGDITKLDVDAIVNAAKNSLLGGGGVDGCIHRAAGPELLAECRTLGGCKTGSAKLTGAYRLPCRYVIHTAGPIWQGGAAGEPELLASCYRSSLELAQAHHCASVAFPLISSGIFGYPKDRAIRVAVDTISQFLFDHEDMTVYLVFFGRDAFQLGRKLTDSITAYIDDHYAEAALAQEQHRRKPLPEMQPPSLDSALEQLDETFSQRLLRLIDEKGMTDVQCYKRANIDRKLFSKLRSDPHYHPSKSTALALAIALELSLPETAALLQCAGLALSPASRADVIVAYFITQGQWDLLAINEALFAFGEPLLAQ